MTAVRNRFRLSGALRGGAALGNHTTGEEGR